MGSLDGVYTFRRVMPGIEKIAAFRQTYDLSLSAGSVTLEIVTAMSDVPRSNATIDEASFGPGTRLSFRGSATTDSVTGELVLDLAAVDSPDAKVQWTCQQLTTHVAEIGAHLMRSSDDTACVGESELRPAPAAAVSVLSCREDNLRDGPPMRAGDVSVERRRDSDRWTFTQAPGLELLGDRCPQQSGGLRRVR